MSFKTAALTVLGVVVGVGALLVLADARWKDRTLELRAKLGSGSGAVAQSSERLTDLPEPVQRYFATALPPRQRAITTAHFSHTGLFNGSENAERWSPFTSDQIVVANPPGFDWDARIRMAPGMTVFVRDAYVGGEGVLDARILGVITVAHMQGTPELARGELMRYLAEAPWYPTRLLPSQGVVWESVNDSSALATLSDGPNSVSLTFSFGEDGLISGVRAASRSRTVDGRTEHLPWEGRFWNYQRRDDMLVPIDGEVAWILPTGRRPYWRGHLTRAHYETQ